MEEASFGLIQALGLGNFGSFCLDKSNQILVDEENKAQAGNLEKEGGREKRIKSVCLGSTESMQIGCNHGVDPLVICPGCYY